MRKVIPIREERDDHCEPTLAAILSDPIVKALMRADSVDATRLTDMLGWIADELQADMPTQSPGCSYLRQGRSTISTLAGAPRGA